MPIIPNHHFPLLAKRKNLNRHERGLRDGAITEAMQRIAD